jgi:lysophospholipase L1-like esterase
LGSGALAAEHWVGTWATAAEDRVSLENDRALGGQPFLQPLRDQTIRMIVHTSLGGRRLRVRLDNRYGTEDLVIGAASVGQQAKGPKLTSAPVGISFAGQQSTAIAPGAQITSDPINIETAEGANLAINLYLPQETPISTSHSLDSLAATGYLSAGNATRDMTGRPFTSRAITWAFLSAVDVDAGDQAFSVGVIGDSITDGVGVSVDRHQRWPDILADRLQRANIPAGVLNLGISGNRVLHPREDWDQSGNTQFIFGASALTRFESDVLDQAGIRYLVVFEGINDIGIPFPPATAQEIIEGYRNLVTRAHKQGIRVYGCTLTPALGTNEYEPMGGFGPAQEAERLSVNRAIRSGRVFDAYIDFDRAVSESRSIARWRPGLSVDGLHPSEKGARLLGQAIPLALFQEPRD